MSKAKEFIKALIKKLPIAFTQNQKYDAQTKHVIAKVCNSNTNCVDIGAHKGEVLDIMLKYATEGSHYAFEPIPDMHDALLEKYSTDDRCIVMDYALSDNKGISEFNYVVSNPSYSGLKKRKYDRDNEQDTKIQVRTEQLDSVLPAGYLPGLIKIDVEGGELGVLEGAKETIKKAKPVIIFEHGLGASDFYGATPEKVYKILNECGLQVSTMQNWLKSLPSFSAQDFCSRYYNKLDYYFIAYP